MKFYNEPIVIKPNKMGLSVGDVIKLTYQSNVSLCGAIRSQKITICDYMAPIVINLKPDASVTVRVIKRKGIEGGGGGGPLTCSCCHDKFEAKGFGLPEPVSTCTCKFTFACECDCSAQNLERMGGRNRAVVNGESRCGGGDYGGGTLLTREESENMTAQEYATMKSNEQNNDRRNTQGHICGTKCSTKGDVFCCCESYIGGQGGC